MVTNKIWVNVMFGTIMEVHKREILSNSFSFLATFHSCPLNRVLARKALFAQRLFCFLQTLALPSSNLLKDCFCPIQKMIQSEIRVENERRLGFLCLLVCLFLVLAHNEPRGGLSRPLRPATHCAFSPLPAFEGMRFENTLCISTVWSRFRIFWPNILNPTRWGEK